MNFRYPITAVQFKRQLSVITTHLMNTHDPSHRINTGSQLVKLGASKPDSESTHTDSYLTHSFCSNALKRSARIGSPTEGKRMHAHLIKLGYYDVLALQTQLLNVYVKCKQVCDARKLFDEMPARNVVTWNVVICGLADSGRGFRSIFHLSFCYFRRMLLEMAGPDNITFTSLLRSCIEHDDAEMGRQLHCFIVKSGFCEDCFVNSALVDLYAKFGLVENARRVFDIVLEKDTVLWNVMVSCYALNGLPEEVFEVYKFMRLEGVKGDGFTFSSLLNSSASLGCCHLGRQIHGLVVRQCFNLDVVVASTLVDMYAKNENLDDARKIFDGMVVRNVISWNTMIVGYGLHGNGKEATKLLLDMIRDDFCPDELTLASVLSSCGNLSLSGEILQVHAYGIKKGFSASLSVANALINAYSKCGSIACALQSFNSIAKPDVVSWTSMLGAYAFHGRAKEGTEFFEKILSHGVKPDRVAFLGVLSACSHGGLVSEGLRFFNLMANDYQLVPDSEHYTCLIDLIGRVGLLDEAFKVLTSMPVEPASDSLGAFIGACKVHGNVELAVWAAEKLLVLEPSKSVNYKLMSNMYAYVGRWFDVARVRKMMMAMCYDKVPGCSWTEIAGKVHTFVSNDKSHLRAIEVYAELTLLIRLLEEEDSMSDADLLQ